MVPDFASAHEADPASVSLPRTAPECVVVIHARDDAGRIALTVLAARALPEVREVLVVESGSTDSTRRVARDSGAVVLDDASQLAGYAPLPLLVVDAARQNGMEQALALLAPVAAGSADAVVAVTQSATRPDAAARLARRGLERAGLTLTGVLTGEHCLSSTAWSLTWPPAEGAGALPGVVADLLRAGRAVATVALEPPREQRPRGLRGRRQVSRALRRRNSL